ncbi:polysaccharide pyruvyl transferase family protein [Roseibacterium beibuensis]|uniref:Polysaccharide pyruvyl transferase domain-containing protein n=1 Tax=[Roseibacterium] beibuensis TaxID=1193142 RepID=A0ABP9L9M4_9RHOB|nr:polysaccharide pyruvyl transferase family protein [Roseibacterium beibuensis]MCS6623937.1 polysaccharide pyruvyl transferase family protein [Roseibacterium beibuensis]
MGKIGFVGIRDRGNVGSKENTGNFLHGFAARQIVGGYQEIKRLDTDPATLAKLREEITHLGFVAATTIPVNREPEFTKKHAELADFIEALGLPVVVFGLGAQAPLNATVEDAWVNENTLRLMNVLAAHSQAIAVRGAFTAELLLKYGIGNAEIIGCQSAFLSRRPDFRFPEICKGFADTPWDRTLVSITNISQELEYVVPAMKSGATHIGQSAHFEYQLKEHPPVAALDDLPDETRALLTKGHSNCFAKGSIDFSEYQDWVRKNFQQFYNVPEWLDFIRGRFDLALGTRFHGNMTAMHGGVPALWVVHDSRTQEFCDHLGLPHAQLSTFQNGTPIREIIGEHLDSSRFNAVYPKNYARFYDYLERQGVTHRLAPPLQDM